MQQPLLMQQTLTKTGRGEGGVGGGGNLEKGGNRGGPGVGST